MPEYLAPGVYVEEVELGPKPIEGVSTSTTGFVGAAVRGPVNKPTLVTNVGEYQRIFGGYLSEAYGDKRWLPYSVEGFFQNGGQRAYVTRVARLPAGPDDIDPEQYAQVAYTILPDRSQARRFLGSKVVAGDEEVDLPYWNGLATGMGLRIGDGPTAEYAVITGFERGRVQVSKKLNDHDAGEGVMEVAGTSTTLATSTPNQSGSTDLEVNDRQPLKNGDWFLVGTGPSLEPVRVDAGGGGTGTGAVTTTTALTRQHAAGETIKAYTVPNDLTGTLTDQAASGATTLTLTITSDNFALLHDGDWLLVQGANNKQGEVVRIVGAPAEGQPVTIAPALKFQHGAGREVRVLAVGSGVALVAAPQAIDLTDATGVARGQVLLVGTDATAEFVEVAEAPTGTVVPLLAPLQHPHPVGTTVRRLETPSSTTALAVAADGGDARVRVLEPGTLAAGDVVEIFDGERTEYAVVARKVTENSIEYTELTRALRYPHPQGTLLRELQPTMRIVAGPARPNPDLWPEPGIWGNQVQVLVVPAMVLRTPVTAPAAAGTPSINLRTTNGVEPGTVLRLPGNRYAVVRLVEGNRVFLDKPLDALVPGDGVIETCEFRIAFRYAGTEEVFGPLSVDERHSQYFVDVINRGSKLVHVLDVGPKRAVTGDELPLPTNGWLLGGGSDGMSGTSPATYVGQDSDDADKRTGLYALNNVPLISIVAVPGQTDRVVQGALIAHAERARYRFAVLDSQKGADLEGVAEQRSLLDSKYAALYYPWVQVYDPLRNGPVFAPPSGHVAGIYARTDQEVGVHKAPANAVVRQVGDLEATVTTGMQDILNPQGINAIRAFPGRGIRVWGARTISSDPSWRYVNVRRLFIYLEHSIDLSTQYAVFEPNDRPLWNRLKASLTSFLTTTWRSGALQGATAAEAFFIRVGLGETMTQDDIDAGRVIILIGVAPVKPAEFVIFRIGQKVGGSEVAE